MRHHARLIACGTLAVTLGALTLAFGQSEEPAMTVEDRVIALERMVANLDNLLHIRTDTAGGPPDRVNRDFNVDRRIGEVERRVQQIEYELQNLGQQIADASRTASQAQNDAQIAQQLARDAASRIR